MIHYKGSHKSLYSWGGLLRLSCGGILSSWCSLRYITVVLCLRPCTHRDEARARLRTQVSSAVAHGLMLPYVHRQL